MAPSPSHADPVFGPYAVPYPGPTAWPPTPNVGNGPTLDVSAPPLRRPREPATAPDPRVLVAVLAMAVSVDVAFRTRIDGLAGFVLVLAVSAGLLFSGRIKNRRVRWACVASLPFGFFLVFRTSLWLVTLDLMIAFGLFVLASVFARGGDPFDVPGRELGYRLTNTVIGVMMAPAFVFEALVDSLPAPNDQRRRRHAAIARGLGLALPVLLVLGLLLASSDAVFASLFRIPVDADSIFANGFFLAFGVWIGAALLRSASEASPAPVAALRKPFGSIEAGIVLGGLVALYGAFAATQLVTALGGADHVLLTANLTRAEYARGGFFQLLAVAGITLGVLAVMKSTTDLGKDGRTRVWLLVTSELAVGLTLAIVAVGIIRLNLYDDAFGLTMLRLFSLATAWWLGIVFVLVGLALAGVGRDRHWLLGAVVVSALVVVLALNAIDPEALVVRHNTDRYAAGALAGRAAEFDVTYTETLSDDAVPALAAVLPKLDEENQRSVLNRICRRDGRRTSPGTPAVEHRPALGWNRSAAEAQHVREELCR